jgi:hypothetical protein
MKNFACEVKSFRKGPSQAIEIIGPRNQRFRGFLRFQRVTTRFISPFFVLGFFCPRASRRKLVLVTGTFY